MEVDAYLLFGYLLDLCDFVKEILSLLSFLLELLSVGFFL
jgi:hypothetical protein